MLIDVARYRSITGDTTSASAVVEDALVDAQRLLEERLGRGLEQAERTERVRRFGDGAVYPRATPIIEVPDGQEIQGVAVLGTGPHTSVLVSPDTHTTITYTGGYASLGDVPAPELGDVDYPPVELQRAIAWAARAAIAQADGTEFTVPPGATSVHVGDVSISWGPGGSPGTGDITFGRSLVRRYRWRGDMAA